MRSQDTPSCCNRSLPGVFWPCLATSPTFPLGLHQGTEAIPSLQPGPLTASCQHPARATESGHHKCPCENGRNRGANSGSLALLNLFVKPASALCSSQTILNAFSILYKTHSRQLKEKKPTKHTSLAWFLILFDPLKSDSESSFDSRVRPRGNNYP